MTGRRGRGLTILVAGVAIWLVMLACAGGSAVTTNGAANAGNGTPQATAAPAKVGSTITANGVSVTLTSVKKLAADDFDKPKSGNQFIVVHVKLVNKSGSEQSYSAFDFHAKSGSGNITDSEFPPSTYTANDLLDDSGTLTNGGNAAGDIVFQVGKTDHKAQMTWQPSFLDNAGDNAWNLGL